MFSYIKLIGIGLAALFVLSVVGAGYAYVTHMQNQLIAVKAQAQQLADAKAIQDETIRQLQFHQGEMVRQAQQNQVELSRLSAQSAGTQAVVDKLAATLQRHNLRTLTNAHPGQVQKIINRATAVALDRLRQASGAVGGSHGSGGNAEPATVPSAPAKPAATEPAGKPLEGAAKR